MMQGCVGTSVWHLITPWPDAHLLLLFTGVELNLGQTEAATTLPQED